MRPYDPRLDIITSGAFLYRTRVRLDSVSVPGDGLTVDVIEGRYRSDAARIPQIELTAQLYVDDTPGVDELLQTTDTRVNVTCICAAPDGTEPVEISLTPLWLQDITRTTDDSGTRVDIRAVDLLGRLSENGMTGPVQPRWDTVQGAVSRLLNACGHTETVTVNGDTGPQTELDVYDGDGATAAAEIAESGGYMLRTTGINTVTLEPAPYRAGSAHILDNVTRYTVRTSRAPTKLVVQTSSTGGNTDTRQTAGGSGGARYGTVTRTVTRPVPGAAAALLRRTAAAATRLTDVELLPFPPLEWGDTVKVKHDGAPDAVVWSVDLPLHADSMAAVMRTPEVQ